MGLRGEKQSPLIACCIHTLNNVHVGTPVHIHANAQILVAIIMLLFVNCQLNDKFSTLTGFSILSQLKVGGNIVDGLLQVLYAIIGK